MDEVYIREWLEDVIETEKRSLDRLREIKCGNSFGAGACDGSLDTCQRLLRFLDGEDD